MYALIIVPRLFFSGAQTLSTVSAFGISSAAGSTTSGTFTADRFHSFVSVTSMIAPSPDWFTGVRDIDLCNGSSWRSSVTLALNLYDAGMHLYWGVFRGCGLIFVMAGTCLECKAMGLGGGG